MTQTQSNLSPPSTGLAIVQLLRWNKPAGRLILMIPALWAVFLAGQGMPPPLLVLVIIAGSLATSAAGCVVNDLWDRNIDPQVERTRTRPLAARTLTIQVGLVVAVVAFACAYGLSRYLNPLSFGLCVAAVPVIVLYPLAKRVFPVPQLVLAIAWGFAVLISWTATVGRLESATGLLWGATVFWTLAFDTIYAMPDRPDDRRLGINSSALFFGTHVTTAIAVFFAVTVILFASLGWVLQLNLGFWLALAVSFFVWGRQVLRLQRSQLPAKVYGQLFRQNVWIGFLILGGIIIGFWG